VVVLWYASSVAPGFEGKTPSYSVPQLASHFFYIVPLTSYPWLSPVYWSLAYEFVFYIIVGLTFSHLIERSAATTVVLALCISALSFSVYNVLDVRIIEFLIGALSMRSIVDGSTKEFRIIAWLVAGILLVFFIGGIANGIVVLFAVVAILFFRSVEVSGGVMFFGSISYSLYLIHVPVGGRIVNVAKRFGEGPLYEFVIVAIALSASLLAAMLLYRFIEVPSMIASRKIGITRPGLFAEPLQAGQTQKTLG
jgi:peptidoglycan/LPS O-acetylase OafA/YrhL